MLPTHNGSFRLFQFRGITVFLHWSWLVIALIEFQFRASHYHSPVWNIAEYVMLFVIVTLHEFGHSLACRSVGGQADQIILWPLGGIAYVNPPPRPGALLWSIAAGPLVNVVLFPILFGINLAASHVGLSADAHRFIDMVALINTALLVFNILPIYPLDGGQILRSLLWFAVGRGRSLVIASVIGIAGALCVIGIAVWQSSLWLGILAFFIISQCVRGFKQARILSRLDAAPRHERLACPSCGAAPLKGDYWTCGQCAEKFDTFATHGRCPGCSAQFELTTCPECRQQHNIDEWLRADDKA